MATVEAVDAAERIEPSVNLPAPVAIDRRARLVVFGSILLAVLLSSLDQTVVGTALPRIVTDLQGADRYVWVVTAYLLSSTVTIPMYGKFSDVYGRKVMLLIGVCLFLAGSWLSGLSQTMNQLIAFRALQGLGAGGIFPVALATVGDLFDARERGKYQGLFGATFGLSFLLGPFIGGWFTEHVSWHWIFYVNVPVGAAALVALARLLPNRRLEAARARDLDYFGTVLFVAAAVPLLIGLTQKGEVDASTGLLFGWDSPGVAGPIAASAALLLLFVVVEARATHPIIPLDLFRNRDYSLSMAASLVFGVSAFSAAVFMPRFYQTVRGISPTASGYYIWPLFVGMMGSSAGSGALISRTGRYKWLFSASAVILLVGGYLMTGLKVSTPDWALWSWMLMLGVGVGPGVAGFTVVVQSLVPPHRIGAATGTLTVVRQLGIVIGLAITGTLFATTFQGRLGSSLDSAGVPSALTSALSRYSVALQSVGNGSGLLQRVLPAAERHLLRQIIAGANGAFTDAIAATFWITIATGTAALVLTLAMRNSELRHDKTAGSGKGS